MRHGTRLFGLASALGVGLLAAASAQGAMVSITSNSPTPDGDDIAQTTATSSSFGDHNYSSNNGAPPGQTFTTGNSASTLDSISIHVPSNGSSDFGVNGQPGSGHSNVAPDWDYTLGVQAVTGSTFTNLVNESGTISVHSADNNTLYLHDGDWLNFVLDTPVALAPNTAYAYSLHTPNGDGTYGTTDHYLGLGVTDGSEYAGGNAGEFDTSNGTIQFEGNNDTQFVLGINDSAVIPEPSSLALLGIGGLAMLRRRRGAGRA